MTATTVTTQAELDAALAAKATEIHINSPAGVWITLTNTGSSRVEAWESSSVVAWESSRVVASAYVAVHLHSARVTLTGCGHIIDVTDLDLKDPEVWQAYTGNTMLLDNDGRDYRLGVRKGLHEFRYSAGCRDFTAEEAIAHWSNPKHPNPKSAALLLAAVQAHIASTAA